MREIEFRAKNLYGDIEWKYGDYHKGYIEDNDRNYDIDLNTLGQYTGLKDKNGKMIFEGDIVKLDKQLFKVVYECANFGLGSNKGINYNPLINKSKEAGSMDFWGCYCDNFVSLFELYWNFNDDENILSEIEIIGNIWDNGDLINEN